MICFANPAAIVADRVLLLSVMTVPIYATGLVISNLIGYSSDRYQEKVSEALRTMTASILTSRCPGLAHCWLVRGVLRQLPRLPVGQATK